MSGDFDDLIGPEVDGAERERLRRVHDLLVASEPPPELPPGLEHPVRPPRADIIPFFPKRRYAAAAVAVLAIAAAAFGGGYLFGHSDSGGFETVRALKLRGTPAAPAGAIASIQLGKRDEAGNWPMLVKVSNLRKLPPRGYYSLWLARDGKPRVLCGTFVVRDKTTTVRYSVPYRLNRFDGWVVTLQPPGVHEPGNAVLTT